jgi:hypothetical protein
VLRSNEKLQLAIRCLAKRAPQWGKLWLGVYAKIRF